MVRSILSTLFAITVCACADGNTRTSPTEGESEVDRVALGGVLPALSFAGVDAAGHRDDVVIPSDKVTIVVVSGGAWCGTCRVLATALNASDLEDVTRIDIVLGNPDNATAIVDDAEAWQSTYAPNVAVAVDPVFVLEPLLEGAGDMLPLVVVVEDGVVVDAVSTTSVAAIADRINTLHERRTSVPAAVVSRELVDDRFTTESWALLQLTTLPGAPKPDPSNAVADSAAAAAFGAAVFVDTAFSPSNTVSCRTCHDERFAFSDNRARAHGVADGPRRSPSITLTAHQRHWFWDGRADSLWAQATGPFENAAEYNSSRTFVARRVVEAYRAAYGSAFPAHTLPSSADITHWPEHAKPGDAAWEALDDETQMQITQIFVNTAKAIAAYERTFRVQPTRFDAYIAGDFGALTSIEKLGLSFFITNGCMQCHWGPRLTDDAFHAVGLGTVVDDDDRAVGAKAAQHSAFRLGGPWDDSSERAARSSSDINDLRLAGQQKTPALRGVADLSFFTHDGSFNDLGAVTSAYGLLADRGDGHVREPWLPFFGETAQWGMLPFLRTLTATPAPSTPP